MAYLDASETSTTHSAFHDFLHLQLNTSAFTIIGLLYLSKSDPITVSAMRWSPAVTSPLPKTSPEQKTHYIDPRFPNRPS